MVAVRSKQENSVVSFPRKALFVEAEERKRLAYYLAPIAMFVLAFYFSAIFLHEAFENEWELLLLPPVFLSPFLIRRFVQGFHVLGYYFLISIFFSLTIGSWKGNPYGSGIIIFFILGLLPYILSKVFIHIWEEARLIFSCGSERYTFTCSKRKAEKIRKTLV